MAIFCDKNCLVCCNHCKHFKEDQAEDSEIIADDEYCGTCTLHGWRVDYLDECLDFFCVAAERKGVGYLGPSRYSCRGPFVLDEQFFHEQAKKGWHFREKDVKPIMPSNEKENDQ